MKFKFTNEENKEIDRINQFSELLYNTFRHAIKPFYEKEGLNDIIGSRKHKGENEGQFGYFHTHSVGELYMVMKKLNVKKLCDLGSGPGLLVSVLNTLYNSENRTHRDKDWSPHVGFEIEKRLVDMSMGFSIKCKDILELTKRDVSRFDALYMWEPVEREDLARKLVEHVLSICSPKHTIIYLCSGCMIKFFKSTKVECIHDAHTYTQEYDRVPFFIYKMK